MKRWILFAIVLLPQVLLLAGMVASAEKTARVGVRVVLEVQPYDPMDLLVGRYINASLAIERIDLGGVGHPQPPPAPGETVFVQLEEYEGLWLPSAIHRERPPYDDIVAIRGTWKETTPSNVALVDYQRDRFYIPDDGNDPSFLRNADGELPAFALVLRVDKSGRSIVEDFLIDGQSYSEWNREYEAEREQGR